MGLIFLLLEVITVVTVGAFQLAAWLLVFALEVTLAIACLCAVVLFLIVRDALTAFKTGTRKELRLLVALIVGIIITLWLNLS